MLGGGGRAGGRDGSRDLCRASALAGRSFTRLPSRLMPRLPPLAMLCLKPPHGSAPADENRASRIAGLRSWVFPSDATAGVSRAPGRHPPRRAVAVGRPTTGRPPHAHHFGFRIIWVLVKVGYILSMLLSLFQHFLFR